MDLQRWIIEEHGAVLDRFEQSVGSIVPVERWNSAAGDGGSSIAWLLYHTSLHEDLAVSGALRGTTPIIATSRASLGLASFPTDVGLGETEHADVTEALEMTGLRTYALDVHTTTQAWLRSLTTPEFAAMIERVDVDGPGALERSGVTETDVPWLYRMWADRPATFFVQWEAIGHRINHVGEMVSVRNRLGLSPF